MEKKRPKAHKVRRRPVASGVILLGLGVWFLIFEPSQYEQAWPALIVIVGLAIIAKYFASRKSEQLGPPPPPPVEHG